MMTTSVGTACSSLTFHTTHLNLNFFTASLTRLSDVFYSNLALA